MEKIKEFVTENSLALFIGILLLVLICWLHHDNHRNDTDYNNTDSTVADIDKRISSVEQRLDGMSERIEQTQKAVTGISQRISTSTGYAIEVADGLGVAEERLESAIQRSKRIEELIRNIEKANR